MKNILVPTDFSDCGKIAEKVAISIAEKNKAKIDFLHMMNISKFYIQSATASHHLPEEIQNSLGKAQQYLNDLTKSTENKGIESKSYISENISVDEIKNHINKHQIDLVVMGSHGASGIKEAFLGSNTQKVLRSVQVPILVVKEEPKDLNFSNIVFASTFKEDVHHVFQKVQNFANIFGSTIHLLYVNMPYNFEETDTSADRIHAFASKYPGSNFKFHIYNAFDEESGILNFSKLNNIDLISTSTHGKSGFMQILSPSITESLANHSQLPVLSVNTRH